MQEIHDSYAWLRSIPGAIHYRLKADYTTLSEKATLLGMPQCRIAKSVYWAPRRATEPLLCAVVGADRDVDERKLLAIARKEHDLPHGISTAHTYPTGQLPGRLGPFPGLSDVERFGSIHYDADLPRDVPLDFAHPTKAGHGMLVTLAALEQALVTVFDGRIRTRTDSIATPAWQSEYARLSRLTRSSAPYGTVVYAPAISFKRP